MPDNPFYPHFEQEISRRTNRREQRMRAAQWNETAIIRTKAAKEQYTSLVLDVLCSLLESNYPQNHVVKTTHDFEKPGAAPKRAITRHAFDWALMIPGFVYYNLMEDTYFSKADLRRSKVDPRYASSRYIQPRDRVVVGVNLKFNEQMSPHMFLCYLSNREAAAELTHTSLVEALIRLHTPTHRTKLVWQYDAMISRALMGLWNQIRLEERARIIHPPVNDALGEVFTRNAQRLGTWSLELENKGGTDLHEYETFAQVDILLDAEQEPRNFVIEPGEVASPLNFPDLLLALTNLGK
jgi:hypothetical protein